MRTIIPQGSLFTITTGQYSNYCVDGVFIAKTQIDIEKLYAEWTRRFPEQTKVAFWDDQFIADMARRGLMEAVECYNIHLTDYKWFDGAVTKWGRGGND